MIGRKRNSVQYLKRSVSKGLDGEPIESFASLGSRYTEIKPRTAREINGTTLVEENTFDFFIRYDSTPATLTASDRATFRGQTYELTGTPMNIDGRDRELRIPVRLVVPSGVGNG